MAVPWLACMIAVAQYYHLPPRVLPSIHAVEGGAPGTVSRNTNGTQDLGVMQVNTTWVPHLSGIARMRPDAVRARLIDDPCFNIAAAGVIMRTYLNEARGDVVRAVGYYHSHTPEYAIPYQYKVIDAAAGLFGGPRPMRHTRAAMTVRDRMRLARANAMREHGRRGG